MTDQPGNQFLTADESMLVDAALLAAHEKFLARLTISSQRVLALVAAHYEVAIEELTPQQIVDWFERDSKIRREQGPDAATLKW